MLISNSVTAPQLWGGVECTINRVGNVYKDQLSLSGHYDRTGDVDRFAALGITTMRYPVLWEKHQPVENGAIDWNWADKQLTNIRRHGIMPVIGLLHHGSGPAYTNLLDPGFAAGLAAYGRKVATRFPWVTHYTPVNEPLTTSRFSGLYGLWYPHHTDARSMTQMLLNQLKATVLTMQAIREINPNAQLVQTEDLAKTHSTPLLQYQADFENNRRWCTYDLLCGLVNENHAMYSFFISLQIPPNELQFFIENPCPPDIIGLNYYITSERYLDEEIANYPAHTHGGNRQHIYADTEAVRTGHRAGLRLLLQEAWQRYRLPIAVTEVHMGCTWPEQLRWFHEVWTDCCRAVTEGVDLRAVTAWSLLGAYDWNSLLTRDSAHYEPGVFDCSNGICQTPLAQMITSLAQGKCCFEEILQEKGWWQNDEALFPHCRNELMELTYI